MTLAQALQSPAIRRGLLSIVAAIAVLSYPELLTRLVWLILVIGAVLLGLIELTSWWHNRRNMSDLIRGLVSLGAAAAVLVFREDAIRAAELALAAIFVVRAIIRLVAARKAWKTEGEDPFWDIVRAVVGLLLAVTLVLVPETITGLVVVLVGLGWIVSGLIVLVYALQDDDPSTPAPSDLFGVLREKSMEPELRNTVTSAIFDGIDMGEGRMRFIALMSFATVIAAFGIEADSTAVVIGAMLIAPLMSPIMALSASILNGWYRRARTSGLLTLIGVAIGVGASLLTALISPALVEITQNSQVLSRTSPTLIDLMIALAAGGAGAYAMTHPKVSNSLPGVAIAVALAPPLAVVGVSLEAAEWAFAAGAFLLFLTNFVGIVVAAGIVFVLSGYSPWFKVEQASADKRKSLGLVGLALLLVALPLAIIGDDILDEHAANSEAEARVDSWLGEATTFDVFSVQVRGSEVEVVIVGDDEPPPPEELATSLAIGLERPIDLFVKVTPQSTSEVLVDKRGNVISTDS